MAPTTSGGLAGVVAGVASLGAVHLLDRSAIRSAPIPALPHLDEIDGQLAFAFTLAAIAGAVVGLAFGALTRWLRRWPALACWSLAFFACLTILVLAFAPRRLPVLPSFAAALSYALVVSLSLPLRSRRSRRQTLA